VARKVVTELTDDIDGRSEAVETVTFGYRGKSYEIDLSQRNVERLDKALAGFVEKARPVRTASPVGNGKPVRGRAVKGNGKPAGPDAGKVREWARGQGLQVNDRGRIPAGIVERYQRETTV